MRCSFPLDAPTLKLISTYSFTMFSLGREKKKHYPYLPCRRRTEMSALDVWFGISLTQTKGRSRISAVHKSCINIPVSSCSAPLLLLLTQHSPPRSPGESERKKMSPLQTRRTVDNRHHSDLHAQAQGPLSVSGAG